MNDFPLVGWLSGITRVYDSGGINIYADCPVCGGVKKLGVHRHKGLFHCFKCLEGGHGEGTWTGAANLIGFVSVVNKTSWYEAKKFVYMLSGIKDIPAPELEVKKEEFPPNVVPVCDLFRLHVAKKFVTRRELDHLDLVYCEEGEYAHRVIIPTFYQNDLTGFEAKAVLDWVKPKSLFPTWQDTLRVYTTRFWNESSSRVVVTESVVDAETFSGVENAVGCYGLFKLKQLKSILDLKPKAIVWALDGDQFGKIQFALEATLSYADNYVIPFAPDEDPNSVGRKFLGDRLEDAVHVKTLWDMYELSVN